MASTKQHIAGFRTTVVALPRMTSELNQAKRRMATALEELVSEYSNSESILAEAQKLIRQIIGDSELDAN